jgi:hypothetical protein
MKRMALQALLVWLAFALLVLLSGCATTRTVRVEVPVPVACDQAEPVRPALAIDRPADLATAALDVQVRNLRADHDARDGYEGELRAALTACRTIGAK